MPDRPFADFLDVSPTPLRIGTTTESREGIDTHPALVDAVGRVAALLDSLGHRVTVDESPAALRTGDTSMSVSSMVGTAARLEAIGALLGRELREGDVEPGAWQLAQMAREVTGVQLAQAQAAQRRFRHEMTSWWADGWDLLLTPTTAQPPPPIGEVVPTAENPFQAQMGSVPFAVFTSSFNSTGQPALSIPAGLTDAGLPIAVQLVAAYGREDQLIAVGHQLELAMPWVGHRAPLVDTK